METLLRKDGLNELPRQDGSWESWIRNESAKRTKLIVFCFYGIHTIVFGLCWSVGMKSGWGITGKDITQIEAEAEKVEVRHAVGVGVTKRDMRDH
jgi:hypothetical protein